MLKLIDRYVGDVILHFLSVFVFNRRENPERPNRILVVKLVAMGDLIVAGPLFRNLRIRYPNASVEVLTTHRTKTIVEHNPYIDRIHYLRFDYFFFSSVIDLIQSLRHTVDIVIELDHYYRISTIVSFFIAPKLHIGYDLQPSRSKFFDKKIVYDPYAPEVEEFLKPLAALEKQPADNTLVPLEIGERDRAHVHSLTEELHIAKSILIHVGTSNIAQSRRWELHKWIELIRLILGRYPDHTIVLVGSEVEKEYTDAISRSINSTSVIDLSGALSVPQLACLCTLSDLYIGLDTGPTHLAAAMGASVIGLYGPNIPDKWGPYSKKSRVVYKKLECSPCTRQYEGVVSACKDNRCMQEISVPDVFAEVQAVLG